MLTAGQNATQHGKAIILQLKISQFLKKPFLNDLLCIGQGAESVRVQSEPKPEPRPQTDGTAKWGNLRRISFKKKKKTDKKPAAELWAESGKPTGCIGYPGRRERLAPGEVGRDGLQTWTPLGSPPPAGRGSPPPCAHPGQGLAGSSSASHWLDPLDGGGRGPTDTSPLPSASWPPRKVDSKSGGTQRDVILNLGEILELPFVVVVVAELLSGG